MARTKLDLPRRFHFSTVLSVRIDDINYGGHLGNDAVLSLMHEARVRFLKEHGYTELNIDGAAIIMIDAVVQYRSERFHGDQLLAEVAAMDFQNTSCDFYYRLTNKATGKEIARAKTGIAFYDYEKKKTISVPQLFKSKFQEN
jgi:acyl-CoA thioester hydrolase